ncbi:ABC transporter substrate-binding protein [Zooshikella marina]|uniref:ABC transporter substrate-binding protein n=1 Tax=Zooshikella ganghwensis TaxID=202772 RepID=UPI001BB01FE6|nr:ABC transporter substrate-binding protein [Zooshikella ganghwensis]MBU2706140.1 ABC transporter substrate-binding protein [Zooshikella ganghwensis]
MSIKKSLYCLIIITSSLLAGEDKNKIGPVKVILNDWTSQLVQSFIAGKLLSLSGYKVEFIRLPTVAQWYKISRGLAHVQMEVWQGTMEKHYLHLLQHNKIIDAGNHKAKTREDWWYPDYVEALCPGLPDWRALKKCSHIFAKNTDSLRGIYLGGPWEKPDAARIRALELNFDIIRAKHGDELSVKLKQAYEEKSPILLFNWTPNWVEVIYEGKFIEFPEYHPDCENDPLWGVNMYFTYDCGNPKNGWLKKIVWKGLDAYPCALHIINNISFGNAEIASFSYWVDIEGMSYEAAADKWLDENQQVWKRWMGGVCQNEK